MINQQPCSYMIEHVNDEITRLNSDVITTMNLVVVSSRVLHVNSVITRLFSQHPCHSL